MGSEYKSCSINPLFSVLRGMAADECDAGRGGKHGHGGFDAQAGMACVGRRQKRAVANPDQGVFAIAEPGDESLYYAPL